MRGDGLCCATHVHINSTAAGVYYNTFADALKGSQSSHLVLGFVED